MVAKSDAGITAKVQLPDGGDDLVVKSGGTVVLETGAKLYVGGSDVTSAVATGGVAGVAAGYKLARGETVLGGTNPTAVATGLATVVSFTATLKGTAAPGVGTSILTANISGATVNVYAWKVTSNSDPTLIASTGTESFYWTAIGT
jgi:hypothetical protein